MIGKIAALSIIILAAPPPGTDEESPISQWFQGLHDSDGTSCCSVADCRHLPTRIGRSGFEVQVPKLNEQYESVGTEWVPVPPDKIIPHKENPTGEPITCWSPGRGVMCFVEGAGT